MAIETGNLIHCADRALHHADWTKFFARLDRYDKLRVASIEDSLKKIRFYLLQIKEAVDSGDVTAIHVIFATEFQFGKEAVGG